MYSNEPGVDALPLRVSRATPTILDASCMSDASTVLEPSPYNSIYYAVRKTDRQTFAMKFTSFYQRDIFEIGPRV